MCSFEVEKNFVMIDKELDMVFFFKDMYENEIKKFRKDLYWYKKELEICEKEKKES